MTGSARKLILDCPWAPGDVVMLTAAVRDLHHFYPGKFLTDVRCPCPEIWENNPAITPLDENDPEVEKLRCSYPLINYANQRPYHCLHGFIDFLNEKLGLAIRPTEFRGAIYLSAQEKAWYSQVREVTRKDIPFWIVAAGGKYDITIKWWDTKRYQEVIDAFRGRIQFVQVGAMGHHHPRLDGAIDLRGKTSIRELIRLVYHAQGVLCSVTGLMHLCAAVATKQPDLLYRPCVVVAGGRESAHWEQYPGHQFLHTIGALDCCAKGGCWKDRVGFLRDGDSRDLSRNLCANVVDNLPRCMDMIRTEDVVRHIEIYFKAGQIKYLSPAEQKSARLGVRNTLGNDYDRQPLNIHNAGAECDRVAAQEPPPMPDCNGRGIVICAGGVRYFANAWVCIKRLRKAGCTLPIEVWHLGKREMSPEMTGLLETLGATTVDARKMLARALVGRLRGWELKPFAIIHSRFRQILFLDADNVVVRNPEYLFDSKEFKQTGAVFWPDYNHTLKNRQLHIWRSCGMRRPNEREFETGQILIDKVRCWRALNLCMWFNENSNFYYYHIHGDKETFHLAFRKLKKSYCLIKHPIHSLASTMCQHDFSGRRIFQHRNMAKWELSANRRIPGFQYEDECLEYIEELKSKWSGSVRPIKTPPSTHRAMIPKSPILVPNLAISAS